jgi:hypothetical protein
MSDESVAEALRSDARRVVIEAPAGTGKTYQAASYAHETAPLLRAGQRLLILAHTRAACDVFASRTSGLGSRLQIGTIDSLVAQIAKIYHRALDLPADIGGWSVEQGSTSFAELARRVRTLLARSEAITSALVQRFPVLICDEHQDASEDQHGIVTAIGAAGARLRVFGDPMQAIYGTVAERQAQQHRWQGLLRAADRIEALDRPHRWANGSPALGEWVLAARAALAAGGTVDLRAQPPAGLTVLRADNQAPRRGSFQVRPDERRPLDAAVRDLDRLLILSAHNATVRGLNAFWGRRIPIWEGYTRDALAQLLWACRRHDGDARNIGRAFAEFINGVGVGFTAGAYSDRLLREIETNCTATCRGKPVHIQALAQSILQAPNHLGIGAALEHLHQLMRTEPSFADITIDLRREFDEARRLHTHGDLGSALVRLSHQRGRGLNRMPPRAISSVHKSKGLESHHGVVLPCDQIHFADNQKNRCLLYVALSRASHSLTLVVSPANPSPLFIL